MNVAVETIGRRNHCYLHREQLFQLVRQDQNDIFHCENRFAIRWDIPKTAFALIARSLFIAEIPVFA
jgi:hypothetical protein